MFLPKILSIQSNFLISLWGANLDLLGKALEPLSVPEASLTEQGMDGCSVPGPHHTSWLPDTSRIANEAAWSLIVVLFLPASSIFHSIAWMLLWRQTHKLLGESKILCRSRISHIISFLISLSSQSAKPSRSSLGDSQQEGEQPGENISVWGSQRKYRVEGSHEGPGVTAQDVTIA